MLAQSLAALIGDRLTARALTLATAESCSGGLLAHEITNVPGASKYFLGGVVTYSNEAKSGLVGVGPATLLEHGAVSEPVARQMARGVRDAFDADVGVGITGIAGPTGGTPTKPVGLVYIAVAGPNTTFAEQFQFNGDREAVKEHTVEEALKMILECVS